MNEFTVTIKNNETGMEKEYTGNQLFLCIGTKKEDGIMYSNSHVAGKYLDISRLYLAMALTIHNTYLPTKEEEE